MADTGSVRIRVAARLSGSGDESGINRDSDNVLTGRHRRLSVSAVEHEILPAKLPDVNVSPSLADALIAGDANRAAVPETRFIVSNSGVALVPLRILHAETALGGAPDLPGTWVYQFIHRIVPEVIMVMATREFKEAITNVFVWIPHHEVGIADVRR